MTATTVVLSARRTAVGVGGFIVPLLGPVVRHAYGWHDKEVATMRRMPAAVSGGAGKTSGLIDRTGIDP
jgi:hypothetical protein